MCPGVTVVRTLKVRGARDCARGHWDNFYFWPRCHTVLHNETSLLHASINQVTTRLEQIRASIALRSHPRLFGQDTAQSRAGGIKVCYVVRRYPIMPDKRWTLEWPPTAAVTLICSSFARQDNHSVLHYWVLRATTTTGAKSETAGGPRSRTECAPESLHFPV